MLSDLEYLTEIDNYESEIMSSFQVDSRQQHFSYEFSDALNGFLASFNYPVLHNVLLIGGPSVNKLSRKLLRESQMVEKHGSEGVTYYDVNCIASANSSTAITGGILRTKFPVKFKNSGGSNRVHDGKAGM